MKTYSKASGDLEGHIDRMRAEYHPQLHDNRRRWQATSVGGSATNNHGEHR